MNDLFSRLVMRARSGQPALVPILSSYFEAPDRSQADGVSRESAGLERTAEAEAPSPTTPPAPRPVGNPRGSRKSGQTQPVRWAESTAPAPPDVAATAVIAGGQRKEALPPVGPSRLDQAPPPAAAPPLRRTELEITPLPSRPQPADKPSESRQPGQTHHPELIPSSATARPVPGEPGESPATEPAAAPVMEGVIPSLANLFRDPLTAPSRRDREADAGDRQPNHGLGPVAIRPPAAIAVPAATSGRGSSSDATPPGANEAPEVHISIGRLEIRAVAPPAPPAGPAQVPSAPRLSLDEYLRRGPGGATR